MNVNNRWDDSTSDKCPLYGKFLEDSDHVLKCQFRRTVRVRDEHVRKLTTTLKKLHTHEKIIKEIIGGITAWMQSTEPHTNTPSVDPFQMHLYQANQAQTSIGWGNMLRGYITTKRNDLQEMHYKTINIGKEFNRRRWKNEVIDHMTKIKTFGKRVVM